MKILLVTDNYPPEGNAGAIRSAANAQRWAALGHDVTVVTSFPNFPEGRIHPGYRQSLYRSERIDGVNVVRVPTLVFSNSGTVRRVIDFLSFLVTGFVAALLVRKPDVILATSPQFFAAVAGWLAAAVRRRPFVLEIRDLWPDSVVAVGAMREGFLLDLVRRLEMRLYRDARLVVTVTDAMAARLQARGIAAEKLLTIDNGVDVAAFAAASGTEVRRRHGLTDRFVVSYIGTVGMAHAIELLADLAGRLLHGHPEIVFLIVGSGARWTALKQLVATRALHNVILVDRVPHAEIAGYWHASDLTPVLLKEHPLFRTVIPSKIFEAMASGTPIITNVWGALDAIVDRYGGAIQLDRPDGEALASAVIALAEDQEARARLGEAGKRAAIHFDRAALADRLLARLKVFGKGSPD